MDTETPEQSPPTPPDAAERQEPTPYHGAALNVFSYRLRKHQENGDVTIIDEYRLSKEPLRIDFIVIKKNRDVELEPNWAKHFRWYNPIEYKSPVDNPPDLAVFDKLLGYSRLYAAQNEVKISDMTATLVCAKPPEKLFKTLEDEFDYEIQQKYPGIYYITQKGVAIEKNLAIQVVVEKSDLLLQALDAAALADKATAVKVSDFIVKDAIVNEDRLGYWLDVMMSEKFQNILEKEVGNMDAERQKKWSTFLVRVGIAKGIREEGREEGRQEGRQEGLQEGIQKGALKVIELLEKGCSLAEAKEKMLLNA